jgi:hypothetical protein
MSEHGRRLINDRAHTDLGRIDSDTAFIMDVTSLVLLRWTYKKIAMEEEWPGVFKARQQVLFHSELVEAGPVGWPQGGSIRVYVHWLITLSGRGADVRQSNTRRKLR